MLLLLSACGISHSENSQDRLQKISEQYQNGSLETEVSITENLGEQNQSYQIAFQRIPDQQDHITILQPESVSGIEFTVAADETSTITYQDTVLQTGLPHLTGVTPADAVSVLLRDLGERLPAENWTEQTEQGERLAVSITDELDGQEVRKDVFLDPETGALCHGDIYVDDSCVLQLDFKKFTWNT